MMFVTRVGLLVFSCLCIALPTVAQTPAADKSRDDAWRAEIRRQLYIPDHLPALNSRVWSTFSPTPGVLDDLLTYATAERMIVPAVVYRPDPKSAHSKGKLPGIV